MARVGGFRGPLTASLPASTGVYLEAQNWQERMGDEGQGTLRSNEFGYTSWLTASYVNPFILCPR
jgi:hypothetical protein